MLELNRLKDELAISKGYPCWVEMEDFIIDNNEDHSEIVAQLLVSAMDEIIISLYYNK